jgi:hypothetical protein
MFVLELKSVEQLCHSYLLRFGSADRSRLPEGKAGMGDNVNLLPNNLAH